MPNYKFDLRDLQQLKKQYEDADVEQALAWALDGSTGKAATLISRNTRSHYTVKAADIKKRLKIHRHRRDPQRALLYTGRRLPLVQFSPRQRWVPVNPNRTVRSGPRKGSKMRRRGVTVRVRKDKPRQLVQGGWHAKGHILRRKDRGDNASQPIMRFGPSIPEMVANPSVIEAAQDLVRRDLPEQFSNRLEYILNRKAGRL